MTVYGKKITSKCGNQNGRRLWRCHNASMTSFGRSFHKAIVRFLKNFLLTSFWQCSLQSFFAVTFSVPDINGVFPSNQGSCSFSMMKFKDFQGPFQGPNTIFQGPFSMFNICFCIIYWLGALGAEEMEFIRLIERVLLVFGRRRM